MERLCTECGKDIEGSKYSQVTLQKVNHTGDLCEECWDIERKKCISKQKNQRKVK